MFPDSGTDLHLIVEPNPHAPYAFLMPWGLKRFQQSRQIHFITFSCYRRLALLHSGRRKQIFEVALERVRRRFVLCVYGYVVMPEHVHLLVSEPERSNLEQAIKSLKQGVARILINDDHFWQARYYDFNIYSERKFIEKLRYMHRNPVKRELCARPEDWPWSSFNHYATGVDGAVEIESQWTASRRARLEVHLVARKLPHSRQPKA